jgi:hypothetical protein
MSEPIWIQVTSAAEAVGLVRSLARHDIAAAFVADRDGCRVRIGSTEGSLAAVLVEVALALKSSQNGVRPLSGPPLEAA